MEQNNCGCDCAGLGNGNGVSVLAGANICANCPCRSAACPFRGNTAAIAQRVNAFAEICECEREERAEPNAILRAFNTGVKNFCPGDTLTFNNAAVISQSRETFAFLCCDRVHISRAGTYNVGFTVNASQALSSVELWLNGAAAPGGRFTNGGELTPVVGEALVEVCPPQCQQKVCAELTLHNFIDRPLTLYSNSGCDVTINWIVTRVK